MADLNHPIVEQSFAIIDREVGPHSLTPDQYAIARRVIHATADFEFLNLLRFSERAIATGTTALRAGQPIITDVTMVKQGIVSMVAKTWQNPIVCCVEQVTQALPGKTKTESGLLACCKQYPQGVYVFGNAPTALLALCESISSESISRESIQCAVMGDAAIQPSLVVGAPVGFVAVLEAKQALAQLAVPQIRIAGRKGGSAVAAAIINALLVLSKREDS